VLDPYVAKLGGISVDVPVFENNATSHKAFPNPFSREIKFLFEKPLSNATLTIRNSLGQVVKNTAELKGDVVTMLREDLETGIYFYEFMEANTIFATGKIVVGAD